jgi:hypothetical protein
LNSKELAPIYIAAFLESEREIAKSNRAGGKKDSGGRRGEQQIPSRDTIRDAKCAHQTDTAFGSDFRTPVESIGLLKPEMTALRPRANTERPS